MTRIKSYFRSRTWLELDAHTVAKWVASISFLRVKTRKGVGSLSLTSYIDFKRSFRRCIWHLHKGPGCAVRTRWAPIQKTRGLNLCLGNKSPGYSPWLITTQSCSHFTLTHLQHKAEKKHIWYAIVLTNLGACTRLDSECKFSRLKEKPFLHFNLLCDKTKQTKPCMTD